MATTVQLTPQLGNCVPGPKRGKHHFGSRQWKDGPGAKAAGNFRPGAKNCHHNARAANTANRLRRILSHRCSDWRRFVRQGIAEEVGNHTSPKRMRARRTYVAVTAKNTQYCDTQQVADDGPVEYGNQQPELDMKDLKLRKMWGDNKDPISESSDYIWNTDWKRSLDAEMERKEREGGELRKKEEQRLAKAGILRKEEETSGFLSLGRAMMFDRVDVNLSQEFLKPPRTPTVQQQAEKKTEAEGTGPRWRFVPTRAEQDRWAKAKRATDRGTEATIRDAKDGSAKRALDAKYEQERYDKLKNDLQVLTLAIGSIGLTTAYFTYSPEIAASYGLGFLGSLAYIRMLGNSVDSIGQNSVRGAAKGAAAQPRLLVPLILTMAYNRWNELLAPDTGIHLQLLPIFVGFFTYKVATVTQTFKELLPEPDNSQAPPS